MAYTKKLALLILLSLLILPACKAIQSVPIPPASLVPAIPSPTSPNLPTLPETSPATTSPTQAAEEKGTAVILEELGGYPCEDSEFTCVKLSAPLDHFNPKPDEVVDVVFAVLPATGMSKGMFVTAIGGPGGSGLASADSYTSAFDPSITENFDIVFFDQRGVSASGNLQCAQAAADFYRADWRANTPDEEAALLEAAQTFSDDCVAELSDTRLLPYLGTEQAVRDLELFRQTLQDRGSANAEKFWLYGESYGTQFAQTYAAAFPQHLAALMLDGTVDLTLSGVDYYRDQAKAFSDVLVDTLNACNADEACANDLGGDALLAYNQLAESLAEQPQEFDFPLPSGEFQERVYTLADLETATSGYLYSESARLIFLRSLAAFTTQENLAPLARMLYDSLLVDPVTLQAIPDPTYSDAVYYGVECMDYAYPGDTPQAAAEAYLRAGDTVDKSLPHFASIFYGDLPCAFWPVRTLDPARPDPLIAQSIPTLVLGATADPATPFNQGMQVFNRLADGYMVTKQGGPHIIYGRGDVCVDDLVTDFLVDGKTPSERETSCDGDFYDAYVPIAAADMQAYANPLEALEAVDNEIYYLPEYYYWDVETPTTVGCPFGGVLSFEVTDQGEALELQNCIFSEGFILSGTGTNDYENEVFTLSVSVSGRADGNLTYTRQADGSLKVTGVYAGNPVDLVKEAED